MKEEFQPSVNTKQRSSFKAMILETHVSHGKYLALARNFYGRNESRSGYLLSKNYLGKKRWHTTTQPIFSCFSSSIFSQLRLHFKRKASSLSYPLDSYLLFIYFFLRVRRCQILMTSVYRPASRRKWF